MFLIMQTRTEHYCNLEELSRLERSGCLLRGPFINCAFLVGGRGQKSTILLYKKTTKRGRGSKIADFETT